MSKEDKNHYNSLITFLKYIITITGACLVIIISVGIYFTYNSTNEMRNNMKEELAEIKRDINYQVSESRDDIIRLNEYAEKTIERTVVSADKTLDFVRTDAKTTAISTSINKVEEAFNENNIQELIDSKAEEIVETRINQMIDYQIEKSNKELTSILNMMPDFMLAIDKFRQGDRDALTYLDSICEYSNDSVKIRIATKLIQAKRNDYINAYQDFEKDFLLKILNFDPKTDTLCSELEPRLKSIIKNDKSLDNVFFATKILSDCLGQEIIPFDKKFIDLIE